MPPPSVGRPVEQGRLVRLISVLAGPPPIEPFRRPSRRPGLSPPDPRRMGSEWSSACDLHVLGSLLARSPRQDIRLGGGRRGPLRCSRAGCAGATRFVVSL